MSRSPIDGPTSARRPARILAGFLVLPLAGLLAWGLLRTSNDGVDANLAQGHAPLAPRFELPLLQAGRLPAKLKTLTPALGDGHLGLGELKGRPVVVNIWASWCDPCREEAPTLERGWRRWGPRGVLFLGLDIQDVPEDAREFLREYGITYPSVREPSNSIARAYGSTGLPETYFISGRGRIVGHVLGVVSPRQLATGASAAKSGRILGAKQGGANRQQR
ncbi:MAG: TlpA family protein disulfide reductase [Solirubrobacterales bacterium]